MTNRERDEHTKIQSNKQKIILKIRQRNLHTEKQTDWKMMTFNAKTVMIIYVKKQSKYQTENTLNIFNIKIFLLNN